MPVRERILDASYTLFSRHGVRVVGVDRIIEESGVAKKTFYRHFPSKADLIVAFLDVRGQRWTRDWLLRQMQAPGATPRDQLLAPFGAFDRWFHSDDFESCSFIRTLLEVPDTADPIHRAAADQLEVVRKLLRDAAESAGFKKPEAVAYHVQILLMGAIVSATRGDVDAARRARELCELLLQSADRADPA